MLQRTTSSDCVYTAASIRERSMLRPRPVRSRSSSAAAMARATSRGERESVMVWAGPCASRSSQPVRWLKPELADPWPPLGVIHTQPATRQNAESPALIENPGSSSHPLLGGGCKGVRR